MLALHYQVEKVIQKSTSRFGKDFFKKKKKLKVFQIDKSFANIMPLLSNCKRKLNCLLLLSIQNAKTVKYYQQ